MIDSKELGEEIERRRRYFNIRQDIFADSIGMHVATYHRRMLHPETYTLGELERICERLGIDMAYTVRRI